MLTHRSVMTFLNPTVMLWIAMGGVLAGPAKGVVQPVRRDHHGASAKGDDDLAEVRWQRISKPGRPGNASESPNHQGDHC